MTIPRSPRYFELRSRIHIALFSGPHFLPREICAELREDEVVLTGVVGSYYQKQMAQESLRKVSGVIRVRNELEVSPARRARDFDVAR